MKTIILALGFMMIFEGLFPLVAPDAWRRALQEMLKAPSETVRKVAFTIVSLGLAVVWIVMEIM